MASGNDRRDEKKIPGDPSPPTLDPPVMPAFYSNMKQPTPGIDPTARRRRPLAGGGFQRPVGPTGLRYPPYQN